MGKLIQLTYFHKLKVVVKNILLIYIVETRKVHLCNNNYLEKLSKYMLDRAHEF